jgi:hypothetical protein
MFDLALAALFLTMVLTPCVIASLSGKRTDRHDANPDGLQASRNQAVRAAFASLANDSLAAASPLPSELQPTQEPDGISPLQHAAEQAETDAMLARAAAAQANAAALAAVARAAAARAEAAAEALACAADEVASAREAALVAKAADASRTADLPLEAPEARPLDSLNPATDRRAA